MHPRPRIRTLGHVKRTSNLLHLAQESRKESTLLPSRASPRAINIWRTDDGRLEHITMLSRGGLDDDVDIAMKGIGRQGRDGVDVGNV